MVLIGASMPSVLAEISFVTNQQEARLLKDARVPPADCGVAAGGNPALSAIAQESADGDGQLKLKSRNYNLETAI